MLFTKRRDQIVFGKKRVDINRLTGAHRCLSGAGNNNGPQALLCGRAFDIFAFEFVDEGSMLIKG